MLALLINTKAVLTWMNEQDYKLVVSEVRYLRQLSDEDKEDFIQDVCVKLLEAPPEYITRGYLRKLIHGMLMDMGRKVARRPHITYSDQEQPVDYMLDDLIDLKALSKDQLNDMIVTERQNVRPRAKRA